MLNEPAPHTVHELDALSEIEPVGQSWQDGEPGVEEKVPPAQGEQTVAPLEL